MNVGRLRAIMHCYKEAGVLLVGAYLVGHHLWTKRRIALLTTPVTFLVLACWLADTLKGPNPAPQNSVTPAMPRVMHPTTPISHDYRPKQPLLLHAKQVAALNEYYLTHSWITSDRLLLVTSAKPTHIYDGADVSLSKWQGQAVLLDLRSGRRRKLEGLTRLFQKMHAMPDSFETSPGGTWLKWTNRETTDDDLRYGSSEAAVARWNGAEYQQWGEWPLNLTYWLDDHRRVEVQGYTANERLDPKEVTVHDVEQKQTIYREVASPAGQRLIHAYYAACEHDFKTLWEPEKPLGPKVSITEAKDVDESMAPLHTYTVRMPIGAEVRNVIVSPTSRRVLYILYFRQVAEAIQPQPKSGVFDIWTSRLDGSDCKELGYLETGDSEDIGDTEPFSSQGMIYLEWLPDGKQFSFIYRKKLYRAAGY